MPSPEHQQSPKSKAVPWHACVVGRGSKKAHGSDLSVSFCVFRASVRTLSFLSKLKQPRITPPTTHKRYHILAICP